MKENNKKRYPADRLKLHALLEKKQESLKKLQAEVDEIEALTREADRTAIHATAELYKVTPEQLAELMRKAYGEPGTQVVPELPAGAVKAADSGEEEADSIDDEEA